MGVVGRTHLGPVTVSDPSHLCHFPDPVLLCRVGAHYCFALARELRHTVRVKQVSACSLHTAPSCRHSQTPPCSQGPTPLSTPRVRILS